MQQQLQLISIQFKEFFREPGILFWTLAFPVLMAWGLGIAFTQKEDQVRHVAVVNYNGEHGQLQKFFGQGSHDQSGYQVRLGNEKLGNTIFHFHPVSEEEATLMVKRGKAAVIMDAAGQNLRYLLDPQNPEAQLIYMQLTDAMSGKNTAMDAENIRALSQTGTRYVDFLVPGLLAMGIMMSAMWGISYSLIEKRSKKLLRRMVATPMSKIGFLVSHLVARIALSVVEAALLLAFAWWYFRIEIQGSLPALVLIFLAGNFAFTGIAIFVSSRTSNTQVGNGWINLVVMPMMICSGIFFSYHNFPEWLVPVIRMLPLTLLADGVRSIFIEGAGMQQVWLEMAVLTGLGTACFAIGLKMYKWY
ncbi:MAG: ABC transporter permease [Bacteroidia bacterium]